MTTIDSLYNGYLDMWDELINNYHRKNSINYHGTIDNVYDINNYIEREPIISEDECSVCLDEIHYGVMLKCNHILCKDCAITIKTYMSRSIISCPYCRGPFMVKKLGIVKTQEQFDYDKRYKEIQEKVTKRKQELMGKNINNTIDNLTKKKEFRKKADKLQQCKSVKDYIKPDIKNEMDKKAWRAKRGRR